MKTALIATVLVVFGLVAAGAAAMLVQSLQLLKPKPVEDVSVLVATSDLEARTPLKEAFVEVKRMPRTGLPADYLANWSQVAGKILKVAVVKGQPLGDSSFIAKGSVDDLLRTGMLAFPVHLSRRVTAENLFYPGCVVDVFATFSLRDQQKGEAVVVPLLQGIRVLGVANETVVSASQSQGVEGQSKKAPGPEAVVTLEVNSRQAAALQLSMDRGTLGLAMRNPTDQGVNPMEPMVVKDGQLSSPTENLDPQTLSLLGQIQQMMTHWGPAGPDLNAIRALDVRLADPRPDPNAVAKAPDPNSVAKPRDPNTVAVGRPEVTVAQIKPSPITAMVQVKPRTWPVTIIRGQQIQETELKAGNQSPSAQEAAKNVRD
jgi:pilus assembly protein CpaB